MPRMIRATLLFATGLLLTAALVGQTRAPQLPLGAAAIQIDARPAAAIQAPAGQQAPAIQLDQTSPEVKATPYNFDDLQNVSIKQLLSLVAQQAGLNLAMQETLDKKISISMQDATLEEALDYILSPEGLHYSIEGRKLSVFKPKMVDATLNFTYVTAVRSQSTSLSASATAGVSGGGAGGLSGGGTSGGSSSSVSSSETTDLLTKVESIVTTFGSKEPGANFNYNKMLGQIFVRDYPENIARMKVFLEQTQAAAGIQVYIEANFVEVQLNEDSQSGVNWSAVLGNTFSLTSSLARESAFRATLSVKGLDVILSGLKTYGRVNVLSKPNVSTLNGQPAVVRIGTQDVFFVTQTQTDTRTGQIIQTAETPASVNEGVVLDVTPNIGPDGIMFLHIHPVITERTGAATSQRGNSVPIIDVRESDTVVKVSDGQTIVIAGLISEKSIGGSTKTLLSSLPLVGGLFGRKENTNKKTDLVVMLTPHLFDISSIPEMTRLRQEHIDQMKREAEQQGNKKK